MRRQSPVAGGTEAHFGEDPWRLCASGAALHLEQLPAVFALGNGVIGVRGPFEPPGAARVYLNGVYERVPIAYHEAAFGYARESDTRPAVADGTLPEITWDGRPLPECDRAELDMASGRLIESISIEGAKIHIETLILMDRPGIVAIRVRTLENQGARLRVGARVTAPPGDETESQSEPQAEGAYDPRLAPGFGQSPWHKIVAIAEDGIVGRADRLARSGFVVAVLAKAAEPVTRGGETVFDVVASYAAAREESALDDARAALIQALKDGFDTLAAEQAGWFSTYWRQNAISMPNAPRLEQALRHAMFQLIQGAGRDGARSLPAKGQTGEGYEGHVFWDADLYALPVLVWTSPQTARAMLAWRIGGLEAARANARAMGQARGALYPWRTIGGRECSSYFPAGSAQYHINADIAFALEAYLAATDDASLLHEGGAEMLIETARIWLEIGYFDPDRGGAFVINRVTGPDEYSAIVDNNLYTNLMAQRHLRAAAARGRIFGLLDAQEAELMERAADAMALPYDDQRGIFLQDEGFFGKQPWPFATTPAQNYPLLLHYHPLHIYRHQVAKQADAVLAIALMPDRFDLATARRMLDAYEAVTVHDSTLSASAFAHVAARVGDLSRAEHYWRITALTDLENLFGNTGHGLHMAALAGAWSALAMGFAGLKIIEDALCFDPRPMPDIGPYGFCLRFRQSLIEIKVTDQAAVYRVLEGAAIMLRHCGETIALGEAPCQRPLRLP